MKLSSFVNKLVEASATAEKAKEMGLMYAGRGWWKDQTGKTVARTIDGNLVRIEDDPEGQQAPTQAAPETQPTNSATEPEEPSDDSMAEPEEPVKMSGILSRLLAANDEDVFAVQKQLAKKLRAAQSQEERDRYTKLLQQAKEYDAKKKADIQASIQSVAAEREKRLAAQKAKYAQKYPSPQI